MNKSVQIRNLKKVLGQKADLIDLEAHIDGRLTYSENKRIILAKAKRRGITKKSKLTFKGEPIYYLDKAENIQSLRSIRSKAQDSSNKAKKTFNHRRLTVEQFKKWKRSPARYDILTIDSKGTYRKQIKQKKLSFADISKFDIL
jgi:hypothetical protein